MSVADETKGSSEIKSQLEPVKICHYYGVTELKANKSKRRLVQIESLMWY